MSHLQNNVEEKWMSLHQKSTNKQKTHRSMLIHEQAICFKMNVQKK
jgi:hypothetical protein